MKKSSLQDMKRENTRLIITTILEKESISRIELSELIGLSPSTVSALTAELIEQGWIVETGVTASTGGRKRTELSIHKNRGYLAILEIGWRKSHVHLLNLRLEKISSIQLSDYYITGNELLEKVNDYLKNEADNLCLGALAGIGLLFQEDMKPSDFNVMYSTSLSSANISFCEALKTQFRVPIIEEFSQVYSFREILKKEKDLSSANSAHIEIGKKIFISITANGSILDMTEGKKADMTPFIEEIEEKDAEKRLSAGIVHMLRMLCMLFPIDTVYLSGRLEDKEELAEKVSRQLEKSALTGRRVQVKAKKAMTGHIETDLGKRVLRKIIYEI